MSTDKTKPGASYSVPKDWESASTWDKWQSNASKNAKAGSDLSCTQLAQICSAPVMSTSKFTTMQPLTNYSLPDAGEYDAFVSLKSPAPKGHSVYLYTKRLNDFDTPPPATNTVTSSLETCLSHYSSDGICKLDNGDTAKLDANNLQSIIIPGNTDKYGNDGENCLAGKCNSVLSYIPQFEGATDAFQGVVNIGSNEDHLNKAVSQYKAQTHEDNEDEIHQDSNGNIYAPA